MKGAAARCGLPWDRSDSPKSGVTLLNVLDQFKDLIISFTKTWRWKGCKLGFSDCGALFHHSRSTCTAGPEAGDMDPKILSRFYSRYPYVYLEIGMLNPSFHTLGDWFSKPVMRAGNSLPTMRVACRS